MMLGPVALRSLRRFPRRVANDIAARGAAQHRSGCATPRVLAMRELEVTATSRAAASGLCVASGLGHRFKGTTPDARTPFASV
jgi:hypothetical protein